MPKTLKQHQEGLALVVQAYETHTDNHKATQRARDEFRDALVTKVTEDQGVTDEVLAFYIAWRDLAVRINTESVKREGKRNPLTRFILNKVPKKESKYFEDQFLSLIPEAQREGIRNSIGTAGIAAAEARKQQQEAAAAEAAVQLRQQPQQEAADALQQIQTRLNEEVAARARERTDREAREAREAARRAQAIRVQQEQHRVEEINARGQQGHANLVTARNKLRRNAAIVVFVGLLFVAVAAVLITLPIVGIVIPFVPQLVPLIVGAVLGGSALASIVAGLARFFGSAPIPAFEPAQPNPAIIPGPAVDAGAVVDGPVCLLDAGIRADALAVHAAGAGAGHDEEAGPRPAGPGGRISDV